MYKHGAGHKERVLDPARILIGSTSNFGAPLARFDQLPGSFLSIDPGGADILLIPLDFAAAGDQASALGGFVQMYTAQSPTRVCRIQDSRPPLAPVAYPCSADRKYLKFCRDSLDVRPQSR